MVCMSLNPLACISIQYPKVLKLSHHGDQCVPILLAVISTWYPKML